MLGPIVIDWTISAGNILAVFLTIGGIAGFFYQLKNDISLLRLDFKHIERQQEALNGAFRQLGTILTQIAVQDTRLTRIEKWIDELRHGDGYVIQKAK